MIRKRFSISILLAFALPIGMLMLSSCYPDDNLTTSQTDVIMTGYYDSVDFTTLKTYYMSDTVFPMREDTSDHSLIKYNDDIIAAIASNMAKYGYTRVFDTLSGFPDVKIASSAITVKNINIYYPSYPYWGWGWGWGWKSSPRSAEYYYPGYPGYNPPGYWPPYYTSYTTGTLLIEMADPSDYRVVNNDTVTPVYWGAGINGVLSGSDKNRIIELIDKSFELSPQIKTK